MQKSKQIDLNRVRSFSEVFNDTRRIIRESFPVLGRGLLYIAGPFYIGVHLIQVFLLYQNPYDDQPDMFLMRDNVAWNLGLTLLTGILANMMSIGTVSYYFALCRERGMNNFTLGDLAKRVFRRMPALLGTTLLFILVIIFVSFIVGLLFAAMAAISPVLMGLFVFVFAIGYILLVFPLSYFFYSIYLVRAVEKAGLGTAISRARQLMTSNYWFTWVIFFCLALILFVVGLSFASPQALFTYALDFFSIEAIMSEETKRTITTAFTFLSEFLVRYAGGLGFVVYAVHFFSLKERYDGEGMTAAIETIGKPFEEETEATY